jgi:hypothetical protein
VLFAGDWGDHDRPWVKHISHRAANPDVEIDSSTTVKTDSKYLVLRIAGVEDKIYTQNVSCWNAR